MTAPVVDVVEYTDPGCSWAWGSEPKLRRLRWRHGARLRWRRVMGGLVGDMARYLDGFDAAAAAPGFARYWERVAATTGMPHPAQLAWMYRSTEPACVAVKAAERQGELAAERVLRRLREATFLFGAPPDTPERIRDALRGLGIDGSRLATDMESGAVRDAFAADWRETRAPNAYVRALVEDGEGAGGAKVSEGHTRYVFPTLLFRAAGREATVPGWKPYERYVEAIEDVVPGASGDPQPDPTPAEAFALWPLLAARELGVLCGPEAVAPPDVLRRDADGGVFWLTAAEAAARGIA
jgi:predicted DsbA family dithiol-disulfide isomerase